VSDPLSDGGGCPGPAPGVPSYAALQDTEGLDDPAELHLIGSWERIFDRLGTYADAGVTDVRLEVAAHPGGSGDQPGRAGGPPRRAVGMTERSPCRG
jgi:hypothetical protein